MTAVRNSRNCAFSIGVEPGSSRFSPLSVEIDQLLCLPDPFTPSNGFSCSRQTSPWRSATFFIISIVSWLWSVAMFAVAKTGAISCWQGATSLCSVLAFTPSFQSSSSKSAMNALTRGRIEPK